MTNGFDPNREQQTSLEFYSSCDLPTDHGVFRLHVYRDAQDLEHLLLLYGDIATVPSPFVRIHSECFTGEVLGSLKCDCRQQLDKAMAKIAAIGAGAIAYLRQEGRGIGLGNKIRAYAEQERGADTIEANTRLGFPVDSREFGIAAEMLRHHNIHSVRLYTNNPQKVDSLRSSGIEVTDVISSPASTNPHNADYLRTKHERLGHLGLKNGTSASSQGKLHG